MANPFLAMPSLLGNWSLPAYDPADPAAAFTVNTQNITQLVPPLIMTGAAGDTSDNSSGGPASDPVDATTSDLAGADTNSPATDPALATSGNSTQTGGASDPAGSLLAAAGIQSPLDPAAAGSLADYLQSAGLLPQPGINGALTDDWSFWFDETDADEEFESERNEAVDEAEKEWDDALNVENAAEHEAIDDFKKNADSALKTQNRDDAATSSQFAKDETEASSTRKADDARAAGAFRTEYGEIDKTRQAGDQASFVEYRNFEAEAWKKVGDDDFAAMKRLIGAAQTAENTRKTADDAAYIVYSKAFADAKKAYDDALVANASAEAQALADVPPQFDDGVPVAAPVFRPEDDTEYLLAIDAADTAYNTTVKDAGKKNSDATGSAWKKYVEAVNPARNAFNTNIAKAKKAYADAVAEAQSEYRRSAGEHLETYEETMFASVDALDFMMALSEDAYQSRVDAAESTYRKALVKNQEDFERYVKFADSFLGFTQALVQDLYDEDVAAAEAAKDSAIDSAENAYLAVIDAPDSTQEQLDAAADAYLLASFVASADHANAMAAAEESRSDGLNLAESDWWNAVLDAATEASKKDATADAVRQKSLVQASITLADENAEDMASYDRTAAQAADVRNKADAASLKTMQVAIDKAYGIWLKADAKETATLRKAEGAAWSTYVAAAGAARSEFDGAVAKADNTWKADMAQAYAAAAARWAADEGSPQADRIAADAAAKAAFASATTTAANAYLTVSSQKTGEWFESVAPSAKSFAESVAGNAQAYIESVAPKLVAFYDAVVEHALTAFNAVFTELKTFADAAIGNAVKWITGVGGKLLTAASESVDHAKTAFDKVAGEADKLTEREVDAEKVAKDSFTDTDTDLVADLAREFLEWASTAGAELLDSILAGEQTQGTGQAFFSVPSSSPGGVGHHFLPIAVLEKVSEFLSRRAYDVGLGFYSGATNPPHGFGAGGQMKYAGIDHGDYSKLVKEEFDEWAAARGFSKTNKMKPDDLKEFIDELIKDPTSGSNDRIDRIRKFNAEVKSKVVSGYKEVAVSKLIDDGKKYGKKLNGHIKGTNRPTRGGFGTPEVAGSLAATAVGLKLLGAAVESLATAPYEHAYLGQAAGVEEVTERNSLAKLLKHSRELKMFPDVNNTPFPSDAELAAGVQLTLIFEGDLQSALKGVPDVAPGVVPAIRTRGIYEDVIIHIVERGGNRYFQVQQVVAEPEQDGWLRTSWEYTKAVTGFGSDRDERGRTVRLILAPGHKSGIGNSSVEIGRVEGNN